MGCGDWGHHRDGKAFADTAFERVAWLNKRWLTQAVTRTPCVILPAGTLGGAQAARGAQRLSCERAQREC